MKAIDVCDDGNDGLSELFRCIISSGYLLYGRVRLTAYFNPWVRANVPMMLNDMVTAFSRCLVWSVKRPIKATPTGMEKVK